MGLLKPVFKSLTGVALATAVAMPALAQDAANDAPVVNASVATTTMTKPQYAGLANETPNDVRILAAAASHDKIAIVVWGGTQELQFEAYKAAQDLVNEGIPVAFILGPDKNSTVSDADFQIYAKSGPQGKSGRYGMEYVGEVRADIYDSAKYVHNANFPQQVAELNLR